MLNSCYSMLKYTCTTLILAIALISCNQESNFPENILFEEMVNYSYHFKSICQDIGYSNTRSGELSSESIYESLTDNNVLSKAFMDYIDSYTKPDDIKDWDEKRVLDRIYRDKTLSDNEKLAFAHSISFAYYIKTSTDYTLTKSATAEECYQSYRKATNRAMRRALVTLAVGLLEPTIAGETLAIGMYGLEMMDAKEDLNECLAQSMSS